MEGCTLNWNTHIFQMCSLKILHTSLALMFIYCCYKYTYCRYKWIFTCM